MTCKNDESDQYRIVRKRKADVGQHVGIKGDILINEPVLR